VKRTRRIGAVTSWTLALERAVEQGPGAGALLAGDVLLRAQDAIPFHVRGIREALRRLGSEGRFPLTIRFEVLRGGNPVEVPVTVGGKDELEAFAATIPTRATITLSSISERSHLREAGIPEGAEIVAVGGRPVESLEGFLARMDENGDQPIALDWRTEGGPVQKSEARTIEGRAASLEDLGLLSLREKREFLRLGFFASLAVGAKKTVKFAVDVFRTLKGIFVGDIGAPNLGGPVLIVAASWHFAEYGLGKLLFFLGILSINLAIINLFPIPILDGGHLLFLSIEKAKGSPVSETIQAIAQYAGILVLLALMIYVTKNDISRFFLK
jgi:regulator of sigma E protease